MKLVSMKKYNKNQKPQTNKLRDKWEKRDKKVWKYENNKQYIYKTKNKKQKQTTK